MTTTDLAFRKMSGHPAVGVRISVGLRPPNTGHTAVTVVHIAFGDSLTRR